MRYALPFLGGLAGSLHCVGMCGPFALALGAGRHRVRRTLLYQTGRVGTLAALGAISGAAGAIVIASGPAVLAGRVLALVAGGCMLAIALETLGMTRVILGQRLATVAQATVGRALAGVLASPSASAPLAFGVFNAFLPCHLVYAFVAQAAATASAGAGAGVMLAFAAGTLPALVGLGVSGGLISPLVRQRLAPLAGVLVGLFALLTIARGVGVLPDHAQHGEPTGGHHQLEHS